MGPCIIHNRIKVSVMAGRNICHAVRSLAKATAEAAEIFQTSSNVEHDKSKHLFYK